MPCLGAEIRIRSRKSCTISSVGMFIIKKVLPSAMQGNACRSLYILCEGSVYAKMISEERKELTLDTLLASICCPRLLYLVPKVHSPLLSWRIETVTFGLRNYLTVNRLTVCSWANGWTNLPCRYSRREAWAISNKTEAYRTCKKPPLFLELPVLLFHGLFCNRRSRCVEKGEQRICTCFSGCNCRKRSPVMEPLLRLYSIDRLQIFQLFSCRVVIQQYFGGLRC